MANQNIQDIDILIHCGIVKYEQNVIQTGVPGFVRIKFDDGIESTGSIQFISQDDANGIRCLNGFQLKKEHCTSETQIGAPLCAVTRKGETSPDASCAAATQTLEYKTIDISKQFHDALINVEQQRNQLNFDTIRMNYKLFSQGVCQSISQYALPLYRTPYNQSMFEEKHINEQTFRDLFTLVGPAYGYSLPQVNLVRIQTILDFYDKYAHMGNPDNITDVANYFKSCAPIDADFVPSLQLKCWPNDIQPFFERIKQNRPNIYHLIINKTSMHVIPKWSTKTPACDRELEFRYSFSAIELILAQQRSIKERILNGIARSIYFKFLKEQKVLPSYFIKTTVLWMCETMDLSSDTEEILAQKWRQYAIDLLEKQDCPHYIIPNVNILGPYSADSIRTAREILLKVNINEIHKIEMFSATGQQFYRNKYHENIANFLSQLKTNDIICALYDYQQLKRQWISLESSQITIDDDEIDMSETLTILNTLRGLDGNYENWKKFREIFLTDILSAEPIWGETVNVESVVDFVEGLFSIGIVLTTMNENISSNTLLSQQGAQCNMEDFQNYQNVIHQYLNPTTLYSSLQSTYAYWYNDSVAAFERRRVIDHHPDGPEMQQRANEKEKDSLKFLIDICRNTPDQNLTLRELFQQPNMMNMTDDESLAIAIQRSLDD
ncbi:unnamed protein product [Rotaria sordida]|uniref:Mab-21-like HhH/H2TH-like domain-containing protein n=1 Tax=Rotaria sordida TaxID=392033 RepID=A0A814UL06_9BILA|nr:unnamed protein product [Rotaria sordida]CAF1507348.1 unnamed protein product [Rotaria sordida]